MAIYLSGHQEAYTTGKMVTFLQHTSPDGSTEPWGISMVLPSKPNYSTVDCLQSTVIKDVRRIDFFCTQPEVSS